MSIKLTSPSPDFYRCIEQLKEDYDKVKHGKHYYIGEGRFVKVKVPMMFDTTLAINTKYLNEIKGLSLSYYTIKTNKIPTYNQATNPPAYHRPSEQVPSEHQSTNTRPPSDQPAAGLSLRIV